MAVQKLSSKNQIVIPKEARQAMGVKGGDELLVVVKDDLTLIMPKPKLPWLPRNSLRRLQLPGRRRRTPWPPWGFAGARGTENHRSRRRVV